MVCPIHIGIAGWSYPDWDGIVYTDPKADLRPIVGVEILTESRRAILLAEDSRGYGNLCRITTARNLTSDFDLIE
jgi:hypothetical protein